LPRPAAAERRAPLTSCRLSPNQIQKLLNQYLVADYEQPINGEIMKAVASKVTEKGDVLLLQAVDMDDSGPYEIAEPRVITALETYTPSCKQSSVPPLTDAGKEKALIHG